MSGSKAIAALRGELPNTRIVVVTSSNDDRDLLAALRAGADGYVLRARLQTPSSACWRGSPTTARRSHRVRRAGLQALTDEPHEPNGHAPSLTEAEQRVVELMTRRHHLHAASPRSSA